MHGTAAQARQRFAAGADVVQELTDQDEGVPDCAFRDPVGNVIRVNRRA